MKLARPGTIQAVRATFQIPQADCSKTAKAENGAGFWVGIDGARNQHLEQAGVIEGRTRGMVEYDAFTEVVPREQLQAAPVAVHADQMITASVRYLPGAGSV